MVNTQTAKTLSYVFLALAIIGFLGAMYYGLGLDLNYGLGFAPKDDHQSLTKNLLTLTAVSIVGASISGMVWKSQNKIQAPQVLNFMSALLASFLVGFGAYKQWDNVALGMGAVIGILTGFEFIAD